MNQPPPNQQFQQQISAEHINFINGTNNIFNQQLPQQQPPAANINQYGVKISDAAQEPKIEVI
ncbi:13513_t:CDS:2 [Ambispora leptoticha]|uniref:13513_t:CDS:1 n=1 Tax=Ambispora leptoticha TaxID=144679 RepID=A0A9N8YTJ1_9GLOM|nr:13513_t:CDS:2 [Ambispora leptoticha]